VGARPLRTSVYCQNTLQSFASCPLTSSWRLRQSLWPPRDRPDPCDKDLLFYQTVFQSHLCVPEHYFPFLSYRRLIFGSWHHKDVCRQLLSPLWFFRESDSLHLFLSTHVPWSSFVEFCNLFFSYLFRCQSGCFCIVFNMFLVFPLYFFLTFSVLWDSPSHLRGVSQRKLQSGSDLSTVDSK